jgi:hypothetical protein
MALVYIDRLIESRGLILTTLNAHRLLITRYACHEHEHCQCAAKMIVLFVTNMNTAS